MNKFPIINCKRKETFHKTYVNSSQGQTGTRRLNNIQIGKIFGIPKGYNSYEFYVEISVPIYLKVLISTILPSKGEGKCHCQFWEPWLYFKKDFLKYGIQVKLRLQKSLHIVRCSALNKTSGHYLSHHSLHVRISQHGCGHVHQHWVVQETSEVKCTRW